MSEKNYFLFLIFIFCGLGYAQHTENWTAVDYLTSATGRYYDEGDLKGAIEDLEKGYKIDPQNGRVRYYLSHFLNKQSKQYRRQKKYKRALECLTRSWSVNPKPGEALINYHEQRAYILTKLGRKKEADKEYQILFDQLKEAIKCTKDSTVVYYNAINFCLKYNTFLEEAREMCSKLLEIEPEAAKAYEIQGDVYFKLNQEDKMLGSYKEALTIGFKQQWQIHQKLGMYYERNNNLRKAKSKYLKALKVSDSKAHPVQRYNSSETCFHLAEVYQKENDHKNVISMYMEGLKRRNPWKIITESKKVTSSRKYKNITVYLIPLGLKDTKLIKRAIPDLVSKFRLKFKLGKTIDLSSSSFVDAKKQYIASKLIDSLEQDEYITKLFKTKKKNILRKFLRKKDVAGIIGITDKDITEEDTDFVYALYSNQFVVMSYHRFRNEFYGRRSSEKELYQKILTQLVDSVVHLVAWAHWENQSWAMRYPFSSVLDNFETKYYEFCPRCPVKTN